MESPPEPTPERIVLSRVRDELEKHIRISGAPQEVHGFLLDHWARLLTTIFLAKGNQDPDWQAGWDTVNALLWSLAPKKGRKETDQMLRLLPALVARLHEGCVALGMRAQERDRFFEGLSLLHAAIAREGLHAAVEARRWPADDAQEDLPPTGPARSPLPIAPVVAPETQALGARAEQQLDTLQVGDRLLIRLGQEDRPMVLHWLSPMGGMYLLTNDEGLETITLTRARLVAKLSQGEAQLLAKPGVGG